MIVLDTNVVVRIMMGNGKVGKKARQALDDDPDRICSVMLAWELAMLGQKRKLVLDISLDKWIDRAATMLRFVEVPVTGAIARDAGGLPGPIHGDPCDRIMIATARTHKCALMTTDRRILDYASAGHVDAIDAER